MLHTLIPDLERELEQLHTLATSGYVIAFNYNVFGPEYMISGYPNAWRAEYEENNYHIGDPVFTWAFMNSGVKRWSDIGLPDVRGVMKRAEEFGLIYGVVMTARKGRKSSFLSMARDDREFEDTEIDTLAAKFEAWCDVATNRASLTDRELDVLRLLKDGRSQRDIADALGIAEVTVKQRAVNATNKLGAANRLQAVAIAVQRGYFE